MAFWAVKPGLSALSMLLPSIGRSAATAAAGSTALTGGLRGLLSFGPAAFNPVTAGLALVAGGLVALYNNSETARTVMDGMLADIKEIGQSFGSMWDEFSEGASKAWNSDSVKGIREWVSGHFTKAMKGISDIVSGPEEKVSDSEDAKWRQAAAEIEAKKQAAASGTAGTSAGEFNRIQAEYARAHPTPDMYGPPRPAGLRAQPKALAPQPSSAKEPASLPAPQSAPSAAPDSKAAPAQAPVMNNAATFQFTINGMPAADFANGVMNVVKAHQNDLQNMISNIVNDQVRKMYAAAGN